MNRHLTAIALLLSTAVTPLLAGAAGVPANFVANNRALPPVVASVLPVPQNPAALTQPGVIPGVASITTSPNSLVVTQNQPRTTIDWKSFNIGSNSWVYFKQQKTRTNTDGSIYLDPATKLPVLDVQPDWVALNRIYDKNPSQIFGRLQADAKIYLINQNGILFGPGSQINVSSLIASTPNFQMDKLTDKVTDKNGVLYPNNFLNPTNSIDLTFTGESYQTDAAGKPVPFDPASAVSNLGSIKTGDLGSVFLLAPKVENAGLISTPLGQTGLVAGMSVNLAPPPEPLQDNSGGSSRTALVALVKDSPGLAVNQQGGVLEADNGMAGMYGGTVSQKGIIRSVTAIKVNGQIELKASDFIQTGVTSRTETPPDTSSEKIHQSFTYHGGAIQIGGLDPDNSLTGIGSGSVKRIDHQGMIYSPSGTVTLKASERTMLEAGSTIDVGGLWQDKPASDRMTSVMLGSVVLRDSQQQKNGILRGQTVTVDPLTGSTLGDISGYLTSQELTTVERSVTGGAISISVPSGDIIANPGSNLLFSGGGYRYGGGLSTTSQLVSGSKAYDISAAPSTLWYSIIGTSQTFSHSKYGIKNTYTGLYLGGSSSVTNYVSSYLEGADAGTATLAAKRVDLYGSLDGHITSGFYQNLAAELTNSLGQQITLGRKEPVAGTFTIGLNPSADPTVSDSVVDTIAVSQDVVPKVHDLPKTGITQVSEVSAAILNAAGLGSLNLFANNTLLLAGGSRLEMDPGSVMTIGARRIESHGAISIPGGTVTLKTSDNKYVTSPEVPIPVDAEGNRLDLKIYLAAGSSISVAGERVSLIGKGPALQQYPTATHVNGGTISILDDTDTGKGVIVRAGSTLNVEGGYVIDTKGKISGGNAGLLALQGDTLVIDGDLRGAALPGKSDGTLVLHAGNVEVSPNVVKPLPQSFDASAPLPPERSGRLLITGDYFASTGFAVIDLFGRNSVVVDARARLATSSVKLPYPVSGGDTRSTGNYVVPVELPTSQDYLGQSSLTLASGVPFVGAPVINAQGNLFATNDGLASTNSAVIIGKSATLRTGPGGQINLLTRGQFDFDKQTYAVKLDSNIKLADQGTVDVSGKLDAPGGNITVLAGLDVTTKAGSEFYAAGYVRDTTAVSGGLLTPMAAGTVKMTARTGALTIPAGARIDVSGSAPVVTQTLDPSGDLTQVAQGSDPGSVTLAYGKSLVLTGTIMGKTGVTGGTGASFSLATLADTNGTYLPLTVDPASLKSLVANGFDDVALSSRKGIQFADSLNLILDRRLTLDAPELTGAGSTSIILQAPWVRLTNSSNFKPTVGAYGKSRLRVVADWVDVTGQIALTGFSSTTFDAKRDIRLYDRLYQSFINSTDTSVWLGRLDTKGDLTFKADRIYPDIQPKIVGNVDPLYNPGGDLNFVPSSFTITSEGKVTTLPSDTGSGQPIYSAGGTLTINAKGGIEHWGTLAAPLGAINLNTDPAYGLNSRVYLAGGSLLTTAGGTMIPYGFVDTDQKLNVSDKNNTAVSGVVISGAPAKSITIGGSEIVSRDGSTIDISGGGSVFSYKFQSGIEGSFNPLTVKGRFVIMPASPYAAPGNAVYLNGGAGLAAGYYSVLPEQFAFAPGAKVITDQGVLTSPGFTSVTMEGYPVVTGYKANAGSDQKGAQLHTYSVRSAAEVLKEGNFSLNREYIAGDSGTITIHGTTSILNGAFFTPALSGFTGGKVDLSGDTVVVAARTAPLPSSFTFKTPISSDLNGTLYLASGALSGQGLREIDLGTTATRTVTLQRGTDLAAPVVKLTAATGVTLENGARIDAIDPAGGGTASILTGGKLSLGATAQIHASDQISLDIATLDAPGTAPLLVDHGVLSITGDRLLLTTDAYLAAHPGVSTDSPGVYLKDSLWNSVNRFGALTLISRTDLTFLGDVSFALSKDRTQKDIPLTLTLDAARIGVQDPGDQGVNITVSTLNLMNSGSASTLTPPVSFGTPGRLNLVADTAVISLNATDLIGPPKDRKGDLFFDGFGQVNMNFANDLSLAGVGRVMTGGADLSLTAARVVTTYYHDATTPYRAAYFTLDTGDTGSVSILKGAGKAGTAVTPGGSLFINAKNIQQTGMVQATAGLISFATTGTITLGPGAEILARGYEFPAGSDGAQPTIPGGRVILSSTGGGVTIAAAVTDGKVTVTPAATVDVSAAGAGDAGSITLQAPVGGVTLAGELLGKADGGGNGGFLTLQTTDLLGFAKGFSTLNSTVLVPGGFTGAVDIRTRSASSLTIASGDTVKARSVTLAVDGGDLAVQGTIDATGPTGGRVELYAGNTLTVSGTVDAHAKGDGAPGGTVVLGAGSFDSSGNAVGLLQIAGGAINVAGGPANISTATGAGKGGSVTLRAPRSATAMNADLKGAITGAAQVIAEAYKSYTYSSVDATAIAVLQNDTQGFMGSASGEAQRLNNGLTLTGGSAEKLRLQPGIEVRSSGNLTVSAPWNLTSWRYGGESGSLTLRAAGNLTLRSSITDAPTPATSLLAATAQNSWNYTLLAGSDPAAANPLTTMINVGVFETGSKQTVYTESGNIRFASGNDTIINAGLNGNFMFTTAFMRYSLATYRGAIDGRVGGTLSMKGAGGVDQAAIQSATGAITLDIGRDLNLLAGAGNGAIRTTGEAPSLSTVSSFWNYAGGGDISVTLDGGVKGSLDKNAWDTVANSGGSSPYNWSAAYRASGSQATTAGLATMGGGNLTLTSAGDITGQVGVFGKGNLLIQSGGDLNGRFLSGQGTGNLYSAGSVGSTNGTVLEATQSRITLIAEGDVTVATIANPSVASDKTLQAYRTWDLRYGADSSAALTSMTGDLHLTGTADPQIYSSTSQEWWANHLLPPTVTLTAARDVTIESSFSMAPSATGTLVITAGRDIDGSSYTVANATGGKAPVKGSIVMGDGDPALIYGYKNRASYPNVDLFNYKTHAASLVALRSAGQARLTAEKGDIRNLQVTLTRSAAVFAGRDINNLLFAGQNNKAGDLTSIQAGRDISFTTAGSTYDTQELGILLGGPGYLTIQAGNDINLGSSKGIQSYGSAYNAGLGAKGSDVTVVAGLSTDISQVFATLQKDNAFIELTPDQDPATVTLTQRYFDTLRFYGQKAGDLNNSGDAAGAKTQIETVRATLIQPLFPSDGSAKGNINMTSSQISTLSGVDSINVFAGGVVNVGKSTIILDKAQAAAQQSSTGITTASGGPINMLSMSNINVNESRVMTFLGGDITMWSDQGGINAGRGSRTAISASPPKLVRSDPNDPNSPLIVKFTPPAVGSGIRATSYGKEPPGNINTYAPSGYVDAGEAGITGNKISYYAPTILNAQNFTATSGPVPSTTGAGVSLGSLSGAGSIAQASKSMEQSAMVGASGDQGASMKQKLMEDLVPSWLDVKVISFDTPEIPEPQEGPLEKKRK